LQKQQDQVQEKTQIDPLSEEIPDFVSDDAILEFEDDEKSDSRISSKSETRKYQHFYTLILSSHETKK
jgi:hypothetical protein